jgi:hypothetical protein
MARGHDFPAMGTAPGLKWSKRTLLGFVTPLQVASRFA